ncbi:Rhomboid protease gluP [Tetrabaena socialis]|uniref:Rhomboid protease gluP n=1 Tax=Tetrabaena socialis TaxID=47790 RepID=A0A2J7ZV52_9CHLO|nr:Rhomboid protease gluP [Tetrabaena socialis]|eukprot:PNH04118.1 Rhomboid protease gluP [Tetrabaena socialis]
MGGRLAVGGSAGGGVVEEADERETGGWLGCSGVPGALPLHAGSASDDDDTSPPLANARPPLPSSSSNATSSALLHSFALLPVRRCSRLLPAPSRLPAPSPLLPAAAPPPHLHTQQHQTHRHLSNWSRFLPSASDFRGSVEGPHRQATNLLLALNVATYGLAFFDRGVVAALALIPYLVAQGEWHRLLTAGFLHTGGLHLLSNCLALHWLGPDLESAAGRGRFAAIYLASVLGGSFMQYQMGSFASVSWGASGCAACGSTALLHRVVTSQTLGAGGSGPAVTTMLRRVAARQCYQRRCAGMLDTAYWILFGGGAPPCQPAHV